MKWKQIVADYFTFSLKDRVAITGIVVLIVAIFFLPGILAPSSDSIIAKTDSSQIKAIEKLNQQDSFAALTNDETEEKNSYNYQFDRTKSAYFSNTSTELFYFDPNTLPADGWKKLGTRDKTITTIQNYLSKGGQFRKPEDLQKIYGLSKNEYERLVPFIRITSLMKNEQNENNYEHASPPKVYFPKYNIIDINAADTTAFISLPGIGSKLAYRIINFREKLGGFYSIDQVKETYGLPDSTFQKIKQYLKLDNAALQRININTATVDELKAHPYIKWSIANPLIAYRNEHGLFAKVEDIMKIMVVTEDLYIKISPYLAIE